MEDPEPLERVARGVPAAFAAIVRKLMAKDPDDRYQTCEELRADLARWTDPERVRAILGAEAEAARSSGPRRPISRTTTSASWPTTTGPSLLSLRDLGDAEPAAPPDAPRRPPPRSPPRLQAPRRRRTRRPLGRRRLVGG